jgi:acyl carrier protein
MDRAEAFAKFQECVDEVLDVGADAIQPETKWQEDLEADSLSFIEITLVVDEAFGIKTPDVSPEDVVTVGQAFAIVCEQLGI